MTAPGSASGPVAPFAGAVLTGGASRRMGRDKALIEIGGRPLAAVVAAALRGAGAAPVLAVGGSGPTLTGCGLVAVADDHPGEGPLGGLITALAHAPEELVVVLACDLPLVRPESIGKVVAALAGDPGARCAAPIVDRRLQPLHAAWRAAALPALAVAFAEGERSVQRVLARLPTVAVTGIGAAELLDVDDPAALAEAQLVAGRQDGQTSSP